MSAAVKVYAPYALEAMTDGSAGFDLQAYSEQSILIGPGDRALIPTGVKLEIPHGYEAQVRPRSGLALREGVTVLNTPGTVDSDYRGEVGVILINHDKLTTFEVKPKDRIAQLVFTKLPEIDLTFVSSVEELSVTVRGDGGFGSTGV